MHPPPQERGAPLIYLNNAATSWPKPPAVLEEVSACLSRPLFEAGRSAGSGTTDYPSAARDALSTFFGTGMPEKYVFTQNATDALNLLIHGFVKECVSPFHAITTELDHNSVLRPLTALGEEGRITLSILPFRNHRVSLAAIRDAIRPETRLVVMTHGSNVLGSVQEIRPIAEYLHDNGIFLIVDGAQTAGHLPINLSDIPLGAFVFTGHKALWGIPGIGGFFLPEPDTVGVTRQGGTGTDSAVLAHPSGMPMRFEAGTPNYPGIASLCAGLRFIGECGPGAIRRKGEDLTRSFIRELGSIPGVTCYNEHPDLPIVSFNLASVDNAGVGFILARAYSIITRTGLHCAPLVHQRIDGGRGCIRVSFSYFNTHDECSRTADAIREVVESADRQVDPDEGMH